MPTPYETALARENLLLKLTALARDMGATAAASADIARRLADDDQAEVRPDGRIRLASGGAVSDAIESMRASHPAYFIPVAPAPAPAPCPAGPASRPTTRRVRAARRLSEANGDKAPRLNGGDE